MDLEALKEELIEGLMSLDNALAPYRMVAHAVGELGAPELVSAYDTYTALHEHYQRVVGHIQDATTPEAVVEAYRQLSGASQPVPEEEGITGI